MKPACNKKTCIWVLILFLTFSHSLWAQEASLTNIIITNNRDDFLLYFSVKGAFRDKMKTAILSGVPATFSFFITLNQTRSMWFDKTVADLKLTHTIKYNNLKKEFSIQRSWKSSDPVVTQSFDEAQRLMREINALKVLPLSKLEKGRQYQVRAKAELNKLTLPLYLHYVLFFISWWDFETDWYTVDFIY